MMWINADTCKPQKDGISFLSERVVVAVLNCRTGATFTDMDCYHYGKERWQRWECPDQFCTYKVTHWMPIGMPQEANKRTRNKYNLGATRYLSSFEIGEARRFEGTHTQFRSLASIACRLKADYGCEWSFDSKSLTVTRTQ